MMLPLCTRVTVLRLLSIAYWIAIRTSRFDAELRHRLDADARIRADALPHLGREELDDALGLRRAARPLDAGVDVLGVLAEDHDVHQLGALHRRGHALEVADRAHAGIEVQHLAQRDVEAADAAADRRRQRSLDGDLVQPARPRACRSGATRRSCSLAFSPAGTSNHSIVFLPPNALFNGGVEHADAGAPDVGPGAVTFDVRNDRIVGHDESSALASDGSSAVGAFRIEKFGIRSRPRFGVTRFFTETVEKLVENTGPIAICAASNREFHAVCTTMVRPHGLQTATLYL